MVLSGLDFLFDSYIPDLYLRKLAPINANKYGQKKPKKPVLYSQRAMKETIQEEKIFRQ